MSNNQILDSEQGHYEPQPQRPDLPNATKILVMGILSLAISLGVGIIFSIIGIVRSKESLAIHKDNPGVYNGYGRVKTGRVLSIVGIFINILMIIYIVFLFTVLIPMASNAGYYY